MVCRIKLTREQQIIAADNHNLIYSFLHKYDLDIDEWYGDAAIGYCQGIATFDSDKGVTLSTYLYRCMSKRIKTVKRRKRIQAVSLHHIVADGVHLIDTIWDHVNIEDEVAVKESFYYMYLKLNEREKRIIQMRIKGMECVEIARILEISCSSIVQVLSEIKFQLFLDKQR